MIQEAEFCCECVVRLGLEVHLRGASPAPNLHIFVFSFALWNAVVQQVGQGHQEVGSLFLDGGQGAFSLFDSL